MACFCIFFLIIIIYVFLFSFSNQVYFGHVSERRLCQTLTRNKTNFEAEYSEPNNKRNHLRGYVIFAHPPKLIITIIPQ